jgi:hypothetical protein
MIPTVGTVERAYQLAASGECASVSDIRDRLAREGYSNVVSHLGGKTIAVALRRLCAESQPPIEGAAGLSDETAPPPSGP